MMKDSGYLSFEDLKQRLWPAHSKLNAFIEVLAQARSGALKVTGCRNGREREVISPLAFVDLGFVESKGHVVATPFRNGKSYPLIFKPTITKILAADLRTTISVAGPTYIECAIAGKLPSDFWPVIWTEILFAIISGPQKIRRRSQAYFRIKECYDKLSPEQLAGLRATGGAARVYAFRRLLPVPRGSSELDYKTIDNWLKKFLGS